MCLISVLACCLEQEKQFQQELGKLCHSWEIGGKALTVQGQKSLCWTADVTVLSRVVLDPPKEQPSSSYVGKES